MSAAHTPGPWRIASVAAPYGRMVERDGRAIAMPVFAGGDELVALVKDANATRDLLLALQDLLACTDPTDCPTVYAAARAAIAAAEGK